MPGILNLKFKGNKSFVAFSNLNDTESLTKTWKVCTKVASYLEQGQRLENLSWRLWHLQNLMVDTDNAKSKREFKKLSKCMGDKLDKEKGRSIQDLPAPDFKRNPSSDLIRQRAVEKERTREASMHTPEHIIQRMQFTFAVDPPPVSHSASTSSQSQSHSASNSTSSTTSQANSSTTSAHSHSSSATSLSSAASGKRKRIPDEWLEDDDGEARVRLPTLFSNSFGPAALLYPSPTLGRRMNYGEFPTSSNSSPSKNSAANSTSPTHGGRGSGGMGADMRIARPTIELPLDELLNAEMEEEFGIPQNAPTPTNASSTSSSPNVNTNVNLHASNASSNAHNNNNNAHNNNSSNNNGSSNNANTPTYDAPLTLDPHAAFSHHSHFQHPRQQQQQYEVAGQDEMDLDSRGASASTPTPTPAASTSHQSISAHKRRASYRNASDEDVDVEVEVDEEESSEDGGDDSADEDFFEVSAGRRGRVRPPSQHHHSSHNHSHNSNSHSSSASAQHASVVSNAGTGAAGRRPVLSVRVPGAMRPPAEVPGASNNAGPGGGPGGVKAECSNCGATHTPLWRRGLNDELNCNACGLYCKLHKRPRPKTMRNNGGGGEGRGQSARSEAVDVMAQCYNCHTTATPLWRKDDEGKTVCNACGLYYKLHGSARPISMKSDVIRKRSRHDARRGGASASVSETPTASPGVSRRASPAPASSSSRSDERASPTLAPDGSTSELSSALGGTGYGPSAYASYHEQQFNDALPFASVDELDRDGGGNAGNGGRANKRRRMSVDSASEPPSSAVSYGDGYTSSASGASTHFSADFSADFPFARFPSASYNNEGGDRSGSNAFWHPPMMVSSSSQPGGDAGRSPGGFLHPPMLPEGEDAPMDYLHPPMALQYHDDGMSFFGGGGYGMGGLHPPMVPGDEGMYGYMGGGGSSAHPPMMPYEDFYDAGGNMRY
ncbi:hypothetical protein R3P38DRAFT_3574701 [Favolaschia claudopus]|uniref:GATA-type domain-containing protein n=1 Tax=Favolaschia claudopus TaxID=2862362 RepID=A0AAW0AMK9_9AGAR